MLPKSLLHSAEILIKEQGIQNTEQKTQKKEQAK